eukprot:scaffold14203_cov170-Amphora_coffeaeformis.AAC.1
MHDDERQRLLLKLSSSFIRPVSTEVQLYPPPWEGFCPVGWSLCEELPYHHTYLVLVCFCFTLTPDWLAHDDPTRTVLHTHWLSGL